MKLERTFRVLHSRCSRRHTTGSTTRPWIDSGVAFSCTQCGNCCRGRTNVFVNTSEINHIADFLETTHDGFLDQYTETKLNSKGYQTSLLSTTVGQQKQCVFLENNLCSIYSVRPTQCRTYPFWPQFLIGQSEWNMEGLRCEGINKPSSEMMMTTSDHVIENLIVHQVHDRGQGSDYIYPDAVEFLRESERQTPGLIQGFEIDYFETHGTSVLFENETFRVVEVRLVESDDDGDDVQSTYRRLDFVASPTMSQTEVRLHADGSVDSSMLVMSVHAVMAVIAVPHLRASLKRALNVCVVGAGCCALPGHLLSTMEPHLETSLSTLVVDAVEPEADILDLAKQYFGAEFSSQGRGRLVPHVSDGLSFLSAKYGEAYDIVIVDAFDSVVNEFGGQAPPLSLSTLEAFRAAMAILDGRSGLLLFNVIGSLSWAQKLEAIARAVAKSEHDQVALVRVDGSDNFVLVVRTSDRAVDRSIEDSINDAVDL